MPVNITSITPIQYPDGIYLNGLVVAGSGNAVTVVALVTDANGNPLPNVTVTFHQGYTVPNDGELGTFEDMSEPPHQTDTAVTDAQGNARIRLVAPASSNTVNVWATVGTEESHG